MVKVTGTTDTHNLVRGTGWLTEDVEFIDEKFTAGTVIKVRPKAEEISWFDRGCFREAVERGTHVVVKLGGKHRLLEPRYIRQ